MHINGKGLRLLMELKQIGQRIKTMEDVGVGNSPQCASLRDERARMMITAEKHCAQAGIPWEQFKARLKKGSG